MGGPRPADFQPGDLKTHGIVAPVALRLAAVAAALGMSAGVIGAQVAPRAPVTVQGETIYIQRGATEADWAILDSHPNVKMIALPEPPNSPPVWTITNSEFAHVASCKNLERLWIGGHRAVFSDDALRSIAGLTKLRILELYGPLVSDAGIAHIAGLTSLEELRLDGNNRIGDAAVASLKNLTNLRDLYFHGARITDAGIANIARLTKLETLTLGHTQVGDGAMATIANFTKLQTVDLQHTNITDAGMAHLKGLTSLRWIALIGTNVTSRGFANLAEMTAMTDVYANGTQIDDGALDSMRKMAGLKTLYVPNTRITEAGLLRALPGFPELEWLSINALPATDKLVPTLLTLKKLKYLEMNGTRISAAGEAQLKAAGIARVNK